MSVAEPAIVGVAALATKLTMMARHAIYFSATGPSRTSNGTCFMLKNKHLAGAEAFAVVVVAIFAGSAGAGKVIAVAALA